MPRYVVICFKFSNFACANTVACTIRIYCIGLLFALNLVTLLVQIQFVKIGSKAPAVVICFKFSNFACANTVVTLILDVLY